MSWRIDELRQGSRIAGAISQIERGETPDWARLGRLQALDLVRAAELELADSIENNEAENARAEQFARDREG
jgi:hypothetical protein